MSKPVFVISCPFDTYSGYGARSRDIAKAIIELESNNNISSSEKKKILERVRLN